MRLSRRIVEWVWGGVAMRLGVESMVSRFKGFVTIGSVVPPVRPMLHGAGGAWCPSCLVAQDEDVLGE